MERLFTSITNAGQTATQNKNIMQTGFYAGEREDYMRENYFMSETTMAPVKIALDHGWSSIKGEHTFMETSVVPVELTSCNRFRKEISTSEASVSVNDHRGVSVDRREERKRRRKAAAVSGSLIILLE